MKKILFTGGTGFIGRNLLPLLNLKYDVYSPTRKELNLLNNESVKELLLKENFDIIIHTAIPNPIFNSSDNKNNLFEDSIRAFMNFYNYQDHFGKMIYFGSGAEFDKSQDIVSINEEEFGRSIPSDNYGFAKYVMNNLCKKSDNIYNLRIFGCFGPTDANFKFITSMINDCKCNKKLVIKQNCYFDYIFVTDILQVIDKIINGNPTYHDYNVCSGNRYSLSEVAGLVKKILESNMPIEILKKDLNKEYTGNNSRLIKEFNNIKFMSLEDGIQLLAKAEEKII